VGELFLIALIFSTGMASLVRPWIGICAYYLLAILGPQYIWWWNFEGLRVSLIVALCTLGGIGLQILKQTYDFSFFFTKQNLWLGFLWLCITCSYFFGPYVPFFASSGLGPDQLFSITNTIFLFYFCAVLEMNETRKLHYLVIVFVVSIIYLTYWANNQYFSQNWAQFNAGRLMGPQDIRGGGIYGDENAFAMLFVTGSSFIYYLGWKINKKWLRWGLWAVIPLSWHAIFLTGSRGGLVGLVVVVLCVLLLSNRKLFALPMLLFFVGFYQWQGGDTMTERSQIIVNYGEDNSAGDRLTAWAGGLRMIVDRPLVGVGLGSFITALPAYYESRPMVAHNTFIQFAAESGVGAGLAYIMVVSLFYIHSKRIRRWCRRFSEDEELQRIDLYNKASTVSFTGLIVCSLFLSLNIYELFFVLLLFNNALYQICISKLNLKAENL